MDEAKTFLEIRDAQSLNVSLERRCGSKDRASRLLTQLKLELGIPDANTAKPLLALALVKLGYEAESVAKTLTWSEFEEFCTSIFRASGLDVKKNLIIKKPRRQIDIFAYSSSFALFVDCKHWKNPLRGSVLKRMARDQLNRALIFKEKTKLNVPTLSVIVTLQNEELRIIDGVAVVPIFTIRSFLNSIYEILEISR